MKMIMFIKLQVIFDSCNFFVSLISFVLFMLEVNDFSIGIDVDSIYDVFVLGEFGCILFLVFINFFNFLMKIIWGEVGWSWGFLKSWNFCIQVLIVVLIFFIGIGVVFLEGVVFNFIDVLVGGEFNLIIFVLAVNIINLFFYFFCDKVEDGFWDLFGKIGSLVIV